MRNDASVTHYATCDGLASDARQIDGCVRQRYGKQRAQTTLHTFLAHQPLRRAERILENAAGGRSCNGDVLDAARIPPNVSQFRRADALSLAQTETEDRKYVLGGVGSDSGN